MLDKIKSEKKRQEILNILHECEPTNEKRLWLVGFLKFVGYNLNEVMSIIRKENSWLDYREKITYYFVQNIFKQHVKNVCANSGSDVHNTDLPKSFNDKLFIQPASAGCISFSQNFPKPDTDYCLVVCPYEIELKKYYGEVD